MPESHENAGGRFRAGVLADSRLCFCVVPAIRTQVSMLWIAVAAFSVVTHEVFAVGFWVRVLLSCAEI
jgi:hypothetical protein